MEKYFKNKKLRLNPKEEIEPHEIILDSLARKKEEELGISEKKFEVPLSKKNLQGFWLAFLILILILFTKTFQLEILQGEKFISLAEDNRLRTYFIRAERGVIYDKEMNQLVWNQPSFDLVLDKRDFPNNALERTKILEKVARIINGDLEELAKQIEDSKNQRVLLLENISHETLILLETKIKELTGIQIEKNTIREYKNGSLFSHIVGFTGKINTEEFKTFKNYSITDYIGKAGLEKSYEERLRGKPGKLQIEKDAFGNQKSEKITASAERGKGLVLYLDSRLQKKATEELEKMVSITGAERGTVVALDPKTGGVLALVSLPSFDNNIFSKRISQEELQEVFEDPLNPLFNRVISGEYLTGSTIKPLIASAALQEKIISAQKEIYDPGFIEVPHEYNPEIVYTFRDWKQHGFVNLKKAIAVSCNVYFYTLGGGYEGQKGLGAERIKKYLNLFGWGKKTGIDLPQESEGFIPDPTWKKNILKEPWYIGNTYHLSIGQGYIRITPIQVASSFVAIANGGKLMQPQVVQKIIDFSGDSPRVIEEMEPKVIRENFIDPENLRIVREGMREAVTYGSSVTLNSLPVKAAAKTGTAETSKPNHYNNWVTVFAPYDDPQIVLSVMVEDVKDLQVAALPVAKNILEWYFTK